MKKITPDAIQFQSTLPRGERQQEKPDIAVAFIFQSTLPRGERLCPFLFLNRTEKISIHAPARGATQELRPEARLLQFQSTLPRGERLRPPAALRQALWISIHAPARGATATPQNPQTMTPFQSTLPRGERRFTRTPKNRSRSYFNPRSREGSDSVAYTCWCV